MSLGFISFLSPFALAGLLTLPVIWWLLRLTPPSPSRQDFPPTRLLKKLTQDETTSAHSPWWLTLLRLLAAACVILALSEPILNRNEPLELKNKGPIVLLVDNGWSSATNWPTRKIMMRRLIRLAEREERAVILQLTAAPSSGNEVSKMNPVEALALTERLEATPFTPDRLGAIAKLSAALQSVESAQIFWLSDGLSTKASEKVNAGMLQLQTAGHAISVVVPRAENRALGVTGALGQGGALYAKVIAPPAKVAQRGEILAVSSREEILAKAPFTINAGASEVKTKIELPLELRNQITKLKIKGEQSAGAVFLLDKRSNWRRVGLISGESEELAQPLLSPLYYIQRALVPYSETLTAKSKDVTKVVKNFADRNASVIVMADIGRLVGEPLLRLTEWVEKGGILVRFAGPHMEESQDSLLPSPLRQGGRRLGGALSWATPQKLAAFDDNSPFAGLDVPDDVLVRRQVLTDPSQISDDVFIWARLNDGTPLVTASKEIEGWVVLVHVTANSDWSNLPLSGLFVDMLRRMIELSSATILKNNEGVKNKDSVKTNTDSGLMLGPLRMLDGYGAFVKPPVTSEPIALKDAEKIKISPAHPPGLYGTPDQNVAINVLGQKDELAPMDAKFDWVQRMSYSQEEEQSFRGPLFMLALLLLIIDSIIVLAMRGLFGGMRYRPALILGGVLLSGILMNAPPGIAQEREGDKSKSAVSEKLLQASLATHFAFVKTGNTKIDQVSQDGLRGLTYILSSRTAVEPASPIAVDLENDELAFYPILYWPVGPYSKSLTDKAAAKVNAFMKHGGMIIFDTKEQKIGLTQELSGENKPLQRLLTKLDIPRLEPVPKGHVLTKSFYLLSSFPGRYRGGDMWVEARQRRSSTSEKVVSNVDGVSTLLITSNDLASAWAVDNSLRPLYAVVPGGELQREMAYRVGVNIVMYALAGNYKADQVHVPALLERLGQ